MSEKERAPQVGGKIHERELPKGGYAPRPKEDGGKMELPRAGNAPRPSKEDK